MEIGYPKYFFEHEISSYCCLHLTGLIALFQFLYYKIGMLHSYHDSNYIYNFPYKISFMFSEISIAETTKNIVEVFGNCLMSSFFIENGHLIVSKGRLWLREEIVVARNIGGDIGDYDKDEVKCIRLFNGGNYVTFYFRDEVDAVLAKLFV